MINNNISNNNDASLIKKDTNNDKDIKLDN